MNLLKKIISFPKKLLRWFLKLSWKKKIIVIVLLIVLVSIFVNQIESDPTQGITLAKAQKEDITETVTETGNISANGSIQVFSPTNGVTTEVYVKNGDTVTEGQNLLTIESSATQQEQSSAYSNYLAAVAALNSAQSNLNVLRADMYSNWDRFRNLATNDTYETGDGAPREQNREAAEFQISQDTWLASEKKYKDQQTVVGQASAQVSSTWLLYQATQNAVVKATSNGTVTNLSVTKGSNVQAQMPTQTTKPLLTIANLSTTEMIVSLSESDIAKVKDGQKAKIDVSAIDDKEYDGVVRRVDSIGTDEMGVIRYSVYVEITNPDDKLRPGMTADAEIITNHVDDVLSVPNAAVKPYQGGRAVRTIDPSTKQVRYIPVEVGIRGTERTQILKGIEEGQEVIISLPNEQLQRPGLF